MRNSLKKTAVEKVHLNLFNIGMKTRMNIVFRLSLESLGSQNLLKLLLAKMILRRIMTNQYIIKWKVQA